MIPLDIIDHLDILDKFGLIFVCTLLLVRNFIKGKEMNKAAESFHPLDTHRQYNCSSYSGCRVARVLPRHVWRRRVPGPRPQPLGPGTWRGTRGHVCRGG